MTNKKQMCDYCGKKAICIRTFVIRNDRGYNNACKDCVKEAFRELGEVV